VLVRVLRGKGNNNKWSRIERERERERGEPSKCKLSMEMTEAVSLSWLDQSIINNKRISLKK
jgi:hypothetical protein